MILRNLFSVLLFLIQHSSWVSADLTVSKPEAGSEYFVSADSASLDIEWRDAGMLPDLSSITQYVFTLCSGPNKKIEAVATLATVSASEVKDNKYTVIVDAQAGSSGTYFVQVVAVSPKWITIHYSDRFTITGMQGNKAAPRVNEPQAPMAETMKLGPDGPPPPIDSASFLIPYCSQTGYTRFAPMQTQPGPTVTATAWTRQNPTSSCSFYRTNTNQGKWLTTITAGWDYTVKSCINEARPRPMPAENGGWYNRADKMTLTTRKVNRYVH
ncbi:LAME_0F06964g1_1 [Lachancea meyersii CBS 8951]|uniref:LAME_0F06964g1_1 n=1 Tax=Lachancea meyersii CBS 8951 TaxID=1266667 RepID=A0A1G4JU48_9SACH|nr:LAME_0F06964g1_1 [Lachancea meyersii CBS 8951]